VSRNFFNTTIGPFGEYITQLLGYDKIMVMNGGCEADEAACMLARRWAYKVKGVPDNQAVILFPTGNFWGRSITASGACDDPSRYHEFGPFTDGFELFKYNDIPDLERMLVADPNICAVFVEPIQGEGGIIIPDDGYLKKMRDLCTKHNVLMVTDEIQSGLGRTGYMFAADHEQVRPDMIVMGKALSGGMLPVSGVMADEVVMNTIGPGEHGNTYLGNPLAMATAHAAMTTLVEEGMIENSKNMGDLFMSELRKINSPLIKEVRGRGLFVGIEIKTADDIKVDGNHFAKMFFKHGVLTKATHD